MEKKQQFSLWYFFAALLAVVALQDYLSPLHVNNLPYSDFKVLLRAGKIADVGVGETALVGTLTNEAADKLVSPKSAERLRKVGPGPHPFTVVRVNDPTLIADLEAAKVPFAGQLQNKWLPTLLSWIVPALIFFALWGFLIKRMSGEHGMGGMGRLHGAR